ncbi:hypothetical protein RCL1_005905 [Eukaryota sp. TZLM3-RCL]
MVSRNHRRSVDSLSQPIRRPRPKMARLSVSMGFKQKVLSDLERLGKTLALQRYKSVSSRQLKDWLLDKEAIFLSDPKALRLSGGGMKPLSIDLEDRLYDYVLDRRARRLQVSVADVRETALEYAAEMNIGLQAGDQWIQNFFRRKQLTVRSPSTSSLTPEEAAEKACSFIDHWMDLLAEYNIPEDRIWNFDETAVFVDPDFNRTVDFIGNKTVIVKSEKLEKFRLTGVVLASAAGIKKLPTLIVGGGEPSATFPENALILTGKSSWMTADLMKLFLDKQFPPLLYPSNAPNPLLLFFDSARAHLATSVKEYLKSRSFLYLVIPGGMTALLQPADVCWFRSLKQSLAREVKMWLDSNPSRTRGGNIRPPPAELMAQWLVTSQSSLTRSLIVNSFQSCFLGPLNDLYIAKNSVFGPAFRRRMFGNDEVNVLEVEEDINVVEDMLVA